MSTEQIGSSKSRPLLVNPDNDIQSKQNTFLTHQQRKSSLLLLTKENESSYLKTKLIIQSNILKEYETWVNTLLSIINSKSSIESYTDLGTPIQKGLEHIAKTQQDNFKIKAKLIDEIAKNNKKEFQLLEKKSVAQLSQAEYDKCKKEQIASEKNQLMTNLQAMANELDEQSEKNKSLNKAIVKDENIAYYNTLNEYIKLRSENLLLKQVIELQNDKNKSLYIERNETSQNRNSLYTSTQFSLSSRRLGNYLIEEEEDWRNDFGFFTCRKAE